MAFGAWLQTWATARGLAAVRAEAAFARSIYKKYCGVEPAPDPDPLATEVAILDCLFFGPQTARELRQGGPGGVIATSEAIERLAAGGLIGCSLMDGRWTLRAKGGSDERRA
jgi:hypothetical protein